MSVTGLTQFDATVHKTNEWLHDLMNELGLENQQGAYHALRTVLHTLRDRLTVQEAVDLAAQLPMLVRGFYYEGWQPNHVPVRDHSKEQFLEHVRQGYRDDSWVDVEEITRSVFRVLTKHVTAGEIDDVRGCLPESIRDLWD